MRMTDRALVCAQQPALEQRHDAVHAGQQLGGRVLPAPQDRDAVVMPRTISSSRPPGRWLGRSSAPAATFPDCDQLLEMDGENGTPDMTERHDQWLKI